MITGVHQDAYDIIGDAKRGKVFVLLGLSA